MIKKIAQIFDKAIVTPKAFVKECASESEIPAYDWKSQKRTVVCSGTARKTFSGALEQWESD